MAHPWQSDRDDFDNNTVPFLIKHGQVIGNTNTEVCLAIKKYYTMLYKSFDPFTHSLLKEKIDEYRRTI